MNLKNKAVNFVLVNTFHPGNIGSSARAIKTMGFSNLYLVQPRLFPDPEAVAMSTHGADILDKAQIFENLGQAVENSNFVFGVSARSRELKIPTLSARQAGEYIANLDDKANISLVFGRERSGLTNEEFSYATHHIYIPADKDYGVLNLSQAVQVVAYEIFQAQNATYTFTTNSKMKMAYPTAEQIKQFEEHMRATLMAINYLKPRSKVHLKLNALFRRANPNYRELKMLRGIFSKIDNILAQKKQVSNNK